VLKLVVVFSAWTYVVKLVRVASKEQLAKVLLPIFFSILKRLKSQPCARCMKRV
jgi:hypothetical protein